MGRCLGGSCGRLPTWERVDLLVLRRQGGPSPPFCGLWSHLTELNVVEFKGPTDSPEEQDLDLLAHVGTGLVYRINEDRRENDQQRMPNRHVSFWYLVPTLGETFLQQAQARSIFTYEPGGLWVGQCFGYRTYLLAYRDAPVEEDTVPLHLLTQEPGRLRALGDLMARRRELLDAFAEWLRTLQPALWKEVRNMATSKGPIFDWAAIGQHSDLAGAVPHIEPRRVLEQMGIGKAVELIGVRGMVEQFGVARIVDEVGMERVIQEIGADRVIEGLGPERVAELALSKLSPERREELIRKLQSGGQ